MTRRQTTATSIFAITTSLVFAGLSAPAHAAPAPTADPPLIAFGFSTVIDTTSVGGSPDTPVQIIYRFSPTLTPVPDSTEMSDDYGPLEKVIVEIGDQCAAMSGPGTSLSVFDDAGTSSLDDAYDVRADIPATTGETLFGLDLIFFRFILVDPQLAMFSDTSLPTTTLFAGDADYQGLDFDLYDPVTREEVRLTGQQEEPFQLSPYVVQTPVDGLRESLSELTLTNGVRTALNKPLDKASGYLDALTQDSLLKARKEFQLFIKQVEAFRDNGIDGATADHLIALTSMHLEESLPKCA